MKIQVLGCSGHLGEVIIKVLKKIQKDYVSIRHKTIIFFENHELEASQYQEMMNSRIRIKY